ncbi:MAG: EamA family transporter [Lentisphaeria bacterium]|nr:EamA family transporter [Lentisphaeria bacterium]
MFNYIWPIGLVVLSNVLYQICAKSVPTTMAPLASLTVTYAVSTVVCAVLYFILRENGSLFQEYGKLNWAVLLFGVVIVGLEVGWIYAYKAGWPVSTATIVQSAFLAAALIVVGRMLYKEPLSWSKIVGILFCLVGLLFINRK